MAAAQSSSRNKSHKKTCEHTLTGYMIYIMARGRGADPSRTNAKAGKEVPAQLERDSGWQALLSPEPFYRICFDIYYYLNTKNDIRNYIYQQISINSVT
jgi:hypothetical protein